MFSATFPVLTRAQRNLNHKMPEREFKRSTQLLTKQQDEKKQEGEHKTARTAGHCGSANKIKPKT